MREILAQRLRECRAKKGCTQIQAAAYADLAERAYANYELTKKMPKLDILVRIANVYEVSLDYLVGRTDNSEMNQ